MDEPLCALALAWAHGLHDFHTKDRAFPRIKVSDFAGRGTTRRNGVSIASRWSLRSPITEPCLVLLSHVCPSGSYAVWTPSESFDHSPYSFRVLSPPPVPVLFAGRPVKTNSVTTLTSHPFHHVLFLLFVPVLLAHQTFHCSICSLHRHLVLCPYESISVLACHVGALWECRAQTKSIKPIPPSTSAHSRPSGSVITLVFLSADVDRRVNDCLILMFHPIRMVLSPVSGAVNPSRAITTMRRMPIWIIPVWLCHSVLSKDQTFPTLLEKYNKAYMANHPLGCGATGSCATRRPRGALQLACSLVERNFFVSSAHGYASQ